MAGQQQMGVGYEGAKSYKGGMQPGSPGSVINPTPPSMGMTSPSATSTANDWAPLDAAFGNRPLYALYKAVSQKNGGSGFCGHQTAADKAKAQAGMAAKPAAIPGANPDTATMPEANPDPVTPAEETPPPTEDAAFLD